MQIEFSSSSGACGLSGRVTVRHFDLTRRPAHETVAASFEGRVALGMTQEERIMPSGGYYGSYYAYESAETYRNLYYGGTVQYSGYYNPTYDTYAFNQSYEGSSYQNTHYYLLIQNQYGSTYADYSYNSGRLRGYYFVNTVEQSYYQAGVGDYSKYTYYAHGEGYYEAQRGQQGVFPGSTYYAYTVYRPYG